MSSQRKSRKQLRYTFQLTIDAPAGMSVTKVKDLLTKIIAIGRADAVATVESEGGSDNAEQALQLDIHSINVVGQ